MATFQKNLAPNVTLGQSSEPTQMVICPLDITPHQRAMLRTRAMGNMFVEDPVKFSKDYPDVIREDVKNVVDQYCPEIQKIRSVMALKRYGIFCKVA